MRLWFKIIVAGLLIACANGTALAQCNPAVDGTYCAENGVRRSNSDTLYNTSPRYSLGEALGPGPDGYYKDRPGGLGAITFGTDGSRCIGLITRSRCKG